MTQKVRTPLRENPLKTPMGFSRGVGDSALNSCCHMTQVGDINLDNLIQVGNNCVCVFFFFLNDSIISTLDIGYQYPVLHFFLD